MQARPVIRQLDEAAVNRIAAGEVVERPASAVKELVENALDAGASRVIVEYADGGRTLIRVTDDGCGMEPAELPLALARHATSKIDGSDLTDIRSFGFRGEALPSLGAVGRLSVTSRVRGAEGARVVVEGGRHDPVRPAAAIPGTVVELRDLFFATPARLKFLRSDRAEAMAIADSLRRLAMAAPAVAFTLRDASGGGEGRVIFRVEAELADDHTALAGRLAAVLGRDFADNSVEISATRDGFRLTGRAALPTYSRGAAIEQFLFVNGRPVRDKLLLGALRAAYTDLLPRDRHPAAALYLWCAPEMVDVNVHPAKTEVRFRDPALVRGLFITALRHAMAEAGHRTSSTIGTGMLGAARPGGPGHHARWASQEAIAIARAMQQPGFADTQAPLSPPPADIAAGTTAMPLGAARAQLHATYIVAETATGIVLVDQHAAHERLTYERMKAERAATGVAAQALLIPDIVELDEAEAARLIDFAPELARLGLTVEPFGAGAVAVRETPAILGPVAAAPLIRDILDELADQGDSAATAVLIDAVISRMSCHGSVRAGRQLRPEEMNALLREMEATPFAGQCNHGRPTYVELNLTDIERLFGRR